jgi:serine/threonine protein phosphatase PrpC
MSDKEARGPVPGEQDEATEPSPSRAPELDLQIVALTDVGRLRPHNEDYVDYYVPSDEQQRESKGSIFLVADGMGGHQAGEVASKGAAEHVVAQYYADTSHDIATSLVRAFRAANQKIYNQAQADSSKAGMGTTLVAAVIKGRKVYLANVGDSRAYLVNERGISQITEDHSWVEEQVRAGLLSPEQAYRHPQRNLLTRALGSKPAVDVDLFEGELGDADTLLLCSDGLTGRVQDAEIAAIVQEHPPEEAARLLVAQANERGGNDNVSVLLVSNRLEAPTVAAPMPAGIAKKEPRPLPLVPILGVIVGLLIVALIALFAAPALFGPRTTPTAVPAVSTPDLTAPAVTTAESGVASPTITLMPTGTLTPQPTAPDSLNSPLPAGSPTTDAGAVLTAPAPILADPQEGVDLSGEVTFAWSYDTSLPEGSEFQVLIWHQDENPPFDVAGNTRATSLLIDLARVSPILADGPGQYYWTVVVVDVGTGARTSPEAFPRHFIYTGS